MKKYNLSLTIKSLLLVFFTLCAVVAVDYLSFESSRKYLLERELGYLRAITDARGAELLMFLDARNIRMLDLAGDAFVIGETRKNILGQRNSASFSDFLVTQKMPGFRHIYQLSILSLDGRVIASSSGSHLGRDDSMEEYFTNVTKNIWLTEKDDGFSGGPDIVFTDMISDPETGSPLGIAAGFMRISEVESVLRGNFARKHLGIKEKRTGIEAIEIVIINRNQLLLSHSPFVKDSVLKQRADTLPARSCLERNMEETGIWEDYRGVEVAGASLCLPALKWTVVYKVDKKTIFEPSVVVGRYSLMAVVATVILVGIMITFFIRRVVLQLRRLSKASGEIASGNYDIVLPVSTNDEVGALSASFNVMASNIKKRELDLAESEERLRAILESMGNPVYMRDMEGKLIFVNRALLSISGFKKEEIIGKTVFDNFPPEIAEELQKTDMQAMESEYPIQVEEELELPRGSRAFLTTKFSLSDMKGKKYAICGVITDISDIKKTEEALRKSETSLREAQRLARLGNWTWDMKNDILEGSEEVFNILGSERYEHTCSDFIAAAHAEDRAALKKALMNALRNGAPYSIDYRIIRSDGVERIVHAQGEVLKGPDGQSERINGTLQDITERKRAEEEVIKLNKELESRVQTRTRELEKAVSELAALNREIETFTYSAAHDLRNPLVLIDGFTLILAKKLKGKLDSEERDHITRIRETIKRMGQLIDDLMNLSTAMRAELAVETVDLSAMASLITFDLKKAEPDRPVEVRIEQGIKVRGDEKLVRMVIENLMGNAWKFTSKKTEQKIEFGSAGEKDGRQVLFVKDNGAGFEMKDADRLFEPFKRLHPAKDFPGTGVGLATVKRIIQRHGGRVWAEGEPEAGAVFYFTLEKAQ